MTLSKGNLMENTVTLTSDELQILAFVSELLVAPVTKWRELLLNPLTLIAAKNNLTILMKSCHRKHHWVKNMNKKCYLEYYLHLSFRYLVK